MPEVKEIWCQVHTFFLFMLAILVSRFALYVTFERAFNSQRTDAEEWSNTEEKVFYGDLFIELFLNVLIIYYQLDQKHTERRSTVVTDDHRFSLLTEGEQSHQS